GQRPPDRPPLPSKQRDGRRANGTGLSVPRSAFRVPSQAESPPRDLPREAEPVEPQRVVLPHPGGQDVGLPRARRQLEAVQQHESLVLERPQGEVDVRHRDAERAPQLGRRRRAYGLESPAYQLTYRVLAGPALGALPLGRRERRLAGDPGEHRLEHWHALGGDPQRALGQEPPRPPLPGELLEPPLIFRNPQSAIRNRYCPHHEQ